MLLRLEGTNHVHRRVSGLLATVPFQILHTFVCEYEEFLVVEIQMPVLEASACWQFLE